MHLTVDMALGCSTNSMLHIPAIAHEIGMDFEIDFANPISEKTPNLCHLAPAGHTYMEDLNEAGGVYAVMNELNKKGLLHTECMTVTGKTLGENIEGCVNKNPEVIRPIDNPYSETGGLAVLKGNLAPDGSVVKRSAVCAEMLVHEGPARIFESDEEATEAIKSGKINPGDVIVIRYEGPKGGPGMREMLNPTSAIAGYGPWIFGCADHRRPLQRSIQRRIYRTCVTGSGRWRTDRACRRRGYHQDQYSGIKTGAGCVRGRTGKTSCCMAAKRAKGQDRISGKICVYGYLRKQRRNSGDPEK